MLLSLAVYLPLMASFSAASSFGYELVSVFWNSHISYAAGLSGFSLFFFVNIPDHGLLRRTHYTVDSKQLTNSSDVSGSDHLQRLLLCLARFILRSSISEFYIFLSRPQSSSLSAALIFQQIPRDVDVLYRTECRRELPHFVPLFRAV